MPDQPALLDFQHISVMRGQKTALDDITLRIQAGEHVAILGPNGSGKSTLIKVITRECYPLARPGSSLTILGRESWNVFELRPLLGVVSNDLMNTCTRGITGLEAVLSGFFSSIGIQPYHHVTPAMRKKAQEVLDLLEVSHLADRFMDEISSGEARRLLIGRALVHDPWRSSSMNRAIVWICMPLSNCAALYENSPNPAPASCLSRIIFRTSSLRSTA